jgi:hypothetical protein
LDMSEWCPQHIYSYVAMCMVEAGTLFRYLEKNILLCAEQDALQELRKKRCYPCSVSDLASSRRRSPALRWVKPNCLTMLEHWVPLPLPGPPAQKSSDHACGKVLCTLHIHLFSVCTNDTQAYSQK